MFPPARACRFLEKVFRSTASPIERMQDDPMAIHPGFGTIRMAVTDTERGTK
jgi:hypothetical protein